MWPPYYNDDCYISIVKNANRFIKCYILDISEDYKSAFLKYRQWPIAPLVQGQAGI